MVVLDCAARERAGDIIPRAAIVVMVCVLGPLLGFLGVWLFSLLFRWTGKWIGGTGSREHLKTAIAWALVPFVFGLLVWIPQLLLCGPEMFTSSTPFLNAHPSIRIVSLILVLVQLALRIWCYVLLCHTVAEVQGFRSAWRGLGNMLLVSVVIFVSIMLIPVGMVSYVMIKAAWLLAHTPDF